MNASKGFSLTELTVMLAIISMLAAIAVPNFYEAKVSSQIAQSKNDMLTIAQGLEAYKSDHTNYPRMHLRYSCLVLPGKDGTTGYRPTLERLTTPVAYISAPSPYWDPFEADRVYSGSSFASVSTPADEEEMESFRQYFYVARNATGSVYWDLSEGSEPSWYLLESAAPDKTHHFISNALNLARTDALYNRDRLQKSLYDPSNGTISRGSIWRSGGTSEGYGSFFPEMIHQANSSRIGHWFNY